MSVTKLAKGIVNFAKKQFTYRTHFSTIREMRGGNTFTKLTKEQKEEVQKFWKENFGKKISLKWHEYFLKVNGEFSPYYIPTYIYYAHITHKLNNANLSAIYSDKNMLDKLLGNKVKHPKSYVKNMNGIYFIDNRVASREEVIERCSNINDGIIKHSIDTSKGMSVIRFKSENGNVFGKNCPKTIDELLDSYGKNFIVQDAIHQNTELGSLNPSSLNTIRILTYWSENDGIVPVFAVVRMGRAGAVVDNASAGGMYCGVNMDGTLKKQAYTLTPFSAHTHTDSGIKFENFRIPKFDEIKAKVVELHQQLPYVRLVGWDMTIDENGEVEIVEANAQCPGLFQGATGPAFGEYTKEILQLCSKNK